MTAFDRAAHRRKDRDYLYGLLAAPETLLVPVWRNKSCLGGGMAGAFLPSVGSAPELVDRADELVWLGLHGQTGCFALDLSSSEQPLALPGMAGAELADLRLTASLLPEADVALLSYARGMAHWHRATRFCGKCGKATQPKDGGHMRQCEDCELKHFPRTDPAVMILITHGDRCLLARSPGFPPGMYSALAGFVEPGETLEQTVVREAFEEVGLRVDAPEYVGSQPWPFPQSLMLAFSATTADPQLVLDREEIEDARWLTRAELQSPTGFFIPPPSSIANRLIQRFVNDGQ